MAYQGRHSHCVQRRIGSLSQVGDYFRDSDNVEIPLVLVPNSASLFYFHLEVPSGHWIIWQKWNKHQGELFPGPKWFWPAYNRISHVVTKRIVVYSAPASKCPTADNVMVDIEISINFTIGPTFQDAENFVYKLGAHRFDELLSAMTQESIRGLVYSVTHDKVKDLREDFAAGMLNSMKSKMQKYGVDISNVKITDVQLPEELQKRLESTTAYKTKLEEQEKAHENKVRELNGTAAQKLETIKESNARKIQELKAEIARYEIEIKKMEEEAKGQAKVDETNARSASEISISKAKAEANLAKINGQREYEETMKKTEIECNRRKIESDQHAQTRILASQGKLAASENQSKARIVEAEAEMKSAESLVEKRKFELEWKRLEILKNMARSGRKFITGERAEQILQDLCPTSKDDA